MKTRKKRAICGIHKIKKNPSCSWEIETFPESVFMGFRSIFYVWGLKSSTKTPLCKLFWDIQYFHIDYVVAPLRRYTAAAISWCVWSEATWSIMVGLILGMLIVDLLLLGLDLHSPEHFTRPHKWWVNHIEKKTKLSTHVERGGGGGGGGGSGVRNSYVIHKRGREDTAYCICYVTMH